MAFKYRADTVGSLLRPEDVLDARDNLPHEQLVQIENKHILAALEHQKRIGMQIFTDGEFRRSGFMGDFFDSVDGLGSGRFTREWSGKTSGGLPYVVVDKVRSNRRMTKHEADFLIKHSPGDIKMTLPTANQFPAICYKKGISDQAYPSYSEFLWDIVPIFEKEITSLADEGVKYIQVDAPRYSYYIDPKWRQYVKEEMGKDPEEALDEAIRVDNVCIENAKRDDNILAVHLCRGNNRSQWYAEGGYDLIAEKLFNELNFDVYLLEYESERAGTFEPLRFLPKGKVVVLGLLSSKLPDLESPDDLMRRIDEASKIVPPENLALSPQCGFASTKEGNLLTEDEQWKKLELLVETARKVWPDG
jgi:5-methyltetrahydropteroyltriglutamate--homocysteine methyltransferase